jgi:hypothetical protein
VFRDAVSTLDVAPTLLRLAGLAAPAAFEGRALPLAETDAADPERVIFAEHRRRLAALRGDRYLARDREGFVAPEPDPVSGGRWLPLPPRSARLADDAAGLPPYQPAAGDGPVAALSAALAGFAARAPAAAAATAPLSGEARDALRALGYLE